MHGCCGVKANCEYNLGILREFSHIWRENLDKMYQPFVNKTLIVIGKISQYRHRKGEKDKYRWDLLLFDTIFQIAGEDERTETRKLWVRIDADIFDEFNDKYEFRREDIIKIVGYLKWYDNYCDYKLSLFRCQ